MFFTKVSFTMYHVSTIIFCKCGYANNSNLQCYTSKTKKKGSDKVVDILESSITSNVIAALSFFAGLISLIITFRTMNSAEKIQKEIEKMKINVLDRQRFLGYKENAIKSIICNIRSVKKAETISKKNCMSLFYLITEAEGFKNVFKDEDYKKIEELSQNLKKINLYKGIYTDKHTQDFLELIIQFKNVLEKGDYSI